MNYNLNRFLEAQEYCYSEVLDEFDAGQKRAIWFGIYFPERVFWGVDFGKRGLSNKIFKYTHKFTNADYIVVVAIYWNLGFQQ